MSADLPVTGGQQLQVTVAGNANGGSGGSGGNGGGQGCNGGGGASLVTTTVNNTFTDLLIAGGGGGDGCQGTGSTTSDASTLGGNAGAPGSDGGHSDRDGGGGGAGTQTTGGAAGLPDFGSPPAGQGFGLTGGDGGTGVTSGANIGGNGGGGGAGYWGGGGGGGGAAASGGFDYAGSGGGGGGGSSLIPAGGSHALDSTDHPEIVVSYQVPGSSSGAPTGGTGGTGTTGAGGPGASSLPPVASLSGVTASSRAVSFVLSCQATAGTSCHFSVQLSTLEKLLGVKILALSARTKRHSARVKVGNASFTLAAGQSDRFTVPLNATGSRLLRRFGKLPVTLAVTLLDSRPPSTLRHTTTLRAKRKRHPRQP